MSSGLGRRRTFLQLESIDPCIKGNHGRYPRCRADLPLRCTTMKKTILLSAIAVCVSLGISGCSLPPAISGNGVLVTESRSASDFHAVSIGGSGRALITQGDTESLTIQADENLLPYIQSEVRNGELRIWTKRGNLRFSQAPVYTLEVRELDRLQLSGSLHAEIDALKTDRLKGGVSGSGTITFGSLEAQSVTVGISGSGTISIAEGTTESLGLSVSGSGNLRAAEFRAESVEVTISGSGDARVWATESLDARVSGSGDIRYMGTPQVSSSISGSGKVRQIQ